MASKATKKTVQLSTQTIQTLQSQVFEFIEPLMPSSVFLVSVAVVREGSLWFLRVDVEKQEGPRITVDECAEVAQVLDEPLDAYAPLDVLGAYTLEVGSPGLFRELTTEREFGFYQGSRVLLKAKSGKGQFLPLQEGTLHHYEPSEHVVYVTPMAVSEKTASGSPVAIHLNEGPGVRVILNPPIEFDDVPGEEIQL